MRSLRSLHSRLVHADGPRLEHQLLHGCIQAEVTEVSSCAQESSRIESQELTLAQRLKAFLSDPKSPGIIDQRESRILCREVLTLRTTTAEHTQHLQALLP
jgi:hypothetical protein